MTARRFPPPWSVEELDACFVVTDRAAQKLSNFEDESGRRAAAKLLTRDQAERIAVNNAKLPELGRGKTVAPKAIFRDPCHSARLSGRTILRLSERTGHENNYRPDHP